MRDETEGNAERKNARNKAEGGQPDLSSGAASHGAVSTRAALVGDARNREFGMRTRDVSPLRGGASGVSGVLRAVGAAASPPPGGRSGEQRRGNNRAPAPTGSVHFAEGQEEKGGEAGGGPAAGAGAPEDAVQEVQNGQDVALQGKFHTREIFLTPLETTEQTFSCQGQNRAFWTSSDAPHDTPGEEATRSGALAGIGGRSGGAK